VKAEGYDGTWEGLSWEEMELEGLKEGLGRLGNSSPTHMLCPSLSQATPTDHTHSL